VPRHDIAAQVADGRLEAKPSRVLSYKDIREAHHILEAAVAGKEW
jgi:NADPH2:quinone reductase